MAWSIRGVKKRQLKMKIFGLWFHVMVECFSKKCSAIAQCLKSSSTNEINEHHTSKRTATFT